jgi:hypothetical protein
MYQVGFIYKTTNNTLRTNIDPRSKYASWYTEKGIEIGSFKVAFEIYFYAF